MPSEGLVKVNIDASSNKDLGSGGMRVIIRYDHGQFITAICCGIPYVDDGATTEAHALLHGLAFAGEVGYNKIMVKLGCMKVMEVMKQRVNSIGHA